jgi:hypothetical protein
LAPGHARGGRLGLWRSGAGVPIVAEVLVADAHDAGRGRGTDGVEVGQGSGGAGGEVGEAAGGAADVDDGGPPARQWVHERVVALGEGKQEARRGVDGGAPRPADRAEQGEATGDVAGILGDLPQEFRRKLRPLVAVVIMQGVPRRSARFFRSAGGIGFWERRMRTVHEAFLTLILEYEKWKFERLLWFGSSRFKKDT